MKRRISIHNKSLETFKRVAANYSPRLKYIYVMTYESHTHYDITVEAIEPLVEMANELGRKRIVLNFVTK